SIFSFLSLPRCCLAVSKATRGSPLMSTFRPIFFSGIDPPPSPSLFPYTTLFRSHRVGALVQRPRPALVRADREEHLPTHRVEDRSEEHTSELQSRSDLVCRLLLEKKKEHNPADVDAGNRRQHIPIPAKSPVQIGL